MSFNPTLMLTGLGLFGALSLGISNVSAQPEGSFDRFKGRVAAVQENYPEAKKEVVPEIGQNAPLNLESHTSNTLKKDSQPLSRDKNKMSKSAPPSVVNLNIGSLRAVQSGDGPILFIADAGRFVISGKLIDIWQKKELTTMEEIERASKRVFLDSMGYGTTSYSQFQLGNGPKRTVIFVDPHCGYCHQLIAEILNSEELKHEFSFVFHVVPVLGVDSQTLAKKLWCSVASDNEKARAILEGDQSINELPARAKCDTLAHDHTIYLSKLINVQAVPFLIAADGRVSQGKPKDLRAFLFGQEK